MPTTGPQGWDEVLTKYLFDRVASGAAAMTQLVFFGGTPADLAVGNVRSAALSADQMAVIWSLQFWCSDITPLADIRGLVAGAARITVGGKAYFEAPIFLCPAGGGVQVDQLVAAAIGGVRNGLPSHEAVNWFTHPVIIDPGVTFDVTAFWNPAFTPSGTFNIEVSMFAEIARGVR
jgi:hypothetical protein